MQRTTTASEATDDVREIEEIKELESFPSGSSERIATVSFPVRSQTAGDPAGNNTSLVAEVIRKRHPALLLCAGWTIPTLKSLDAVKRATRGTGSVVILETFSKDPAYYRVADGQSFEMGEQCFSVRAETEEKERVTALAVALPNRTFPFRSRSALLLNCGEVMVVRGRQEVEFQWTVPLELREAVRAPGALILNPTHTRMGNAGTVQAWRRFLSAEGRAYLSTSNWDLDAGQSPSETLQSLWYDGRTATPVFRFLEDRICYRDWDLPSV